MGETWSIPSVRAVPFAVNQFRWGDDIGKKRNKGKLANYKKKLQVLITLAIWSLSFVSPFNK